MKTAVQATRKANTKNPQNLYDLFILQLQDLCYAENKIVKSLPKFEKAATNSKLKQAIRRHLQESEDQLETVTNILKAEGVTQTKKCEAIEGLAKEGEGALELDCPPQVKDAAIIAALQRVEHYEIAGYGTVISYAQLLGEDSYQEDLEEILEQEKHADVTLSQIATGGAFSRGVNDEAEEEEDDVEEEEEEEELSSRNYDRYRSAPSRRYQSEWDNEDRSYSSSPRSIQLRNGEDYQDRYSSSRQPSMNWSRYQEDEPRYESRSYNNNQSSSYRDYDDNYRPSSPAYYDRDQQRRYRDYESYCNNNRCDNQRHDWNENREYSSQGYSPYRRY